MSKYTPGKWEMVEAIFDGTDIIRIESGEKIIAIITVDDAEDIAAEDIANAHLIAQAPDLLEAAKAMRGFIIEIEDQLNEMGEELRNEAQSALFQVLYPAFRSFVFDFHKNEADKRIAKAEGK